MREPGEQVPAGTLLWTSGSQQERGRGRSIHEDFSAVYQQCLPVVQRYTLSRVGEPAVADDLVGDIFERALGNWETFEHRSRPHVWLLGIARHVIADYWREQARERPSSSALLEVFGTEQGEPQQVVERNQLRAVLITAIAALSEEDQELLRLRYGADLSFRDIAGLLNKGEITLRVRLHRLLKRLRRALEADSEVGS